jgi:hypothetical protein
MGGMISIADLIKTVIVDDRVRFQFLPDCITRITRSKKGPSFVTFGTEGMFPADMLSAKSAKNIGIVIWVPKDVYNKAKGCL